MPELGRFVSPDILIPDPADPQSYNRYAYVLNNPLVYIDPSGHRVDSPDFIPDQEIVTNVMTPFWWPPFNPLAPAFETLRNSTIGAELVDLVRGKNLSVTYGEFANFAFSDSWIHLKPDFQNPNVMVQAWPAALVAHELVHVLAEGNDAYYAWGRGTLQMEVEADIVRYTIRYELTQDPAYLRRVFEYATTDLQVAYETVIEMNPSTYGNPLLYDRGSSGPNPWAKNLMELGFSASVVSRIMMYAMIGRGVE